MTTITATQSSTTRRQNRSKAELLVLYNEYRAEPDSKTTGEWIKHLHLSPNTFSKWKKGNGPKLPKQSSVANYELYGSPSRRSIEPEKQNDLRYELEFGEIADKMDLSIMEVRKLYGSGMRKIKLLIDRDASMGETLRQWLDSDEAAIMDHSF